MIPNQRPLFDIPEDVVYLNCASQGPLMKSVCAAGETGVMRKAHPWTGFRQEAAADAEEARGLFARLIGATADDVALVPATSYGVAVAAANLPIEPGARVVVLQDQFPSNFHAWRLRAIECGADLIPVPRPADGDWTRAVLDEIDDRTGLVSLPPCHWRDGSALDLTRIGARCRDVGAAFVIDATQAVGAMPVDVKTLRPDFLTCSAYKWLLCPYSTGFLYAAPHRQEGVPLEHYRWSVPGIPGEGAKRGDDLDDAAGARRYDVGERNNPISTIMVATALKQLLEWTPAAIAGTLKSLTDKVAEGAAMRGYAVPPEAHRVSHFIGLRTPDEPPADLPERMAAHHVHISLRGDAIRVSPHLYNSAGDIDRFFGALDAVL
jgi:selenocysteine lyase/cysteine desulfurase